MDNQIEIKLEHQQVIDALNELVEKNDDLSPVFGEIGEYLIGSTMQRIDQGVAPDGTPWLPLSDITAKLKGHNKPLIGETKRLSSEWHYSSTPTKLEFGTNVGYAAVHHFGQTIKPVKAKALHFGGVFTQSVTIPARPILGISDTDAAHIIDTLKGYYSV